MPSKVQLYAQMADRTAEQITGSFQKWTAFLTTAARLYKYPYNEQLMIFAQHPEATACAEYDLWNKQMRRYVRRGSKGIALVDTSSDQPKLRYVFDVSDTSGGENSRRPYLWEYRQEHREVVSAALEQHFDVVFGLVDRMTQPLVIPHEKSLAARGFYALYLRRFQYCSRFRLASCFRRSCLAQAGQYFVRLGEE